MFHLLVSQRTAVQASMGKVTEVIGRPSNTKEDYKALFCY